MKMVSVIGARPQFIKYAPLSKELRMTHQDLLIHTGQHYDYNMNGVFFDELGIPKPDYNLGVGSGTHAYQTGQMLKGIEDVLIKEKPDLTFVYGDTNSTLAGALSSVKLHIKVAHVEAGVRSFDKSMPEEINRVLTDFCSDYLFCPTQTAVDNLKREGITKGVYLTGDVMVDALNSNRAIAEQSGILEKLKITSKNYLLVTLHRASNSDIRLNLENIINAFIKLSEMGEIMVFPIHPRTVNALKNYGLFDRLNASVMLTQPLGYLDFLKLLNHAKKVLTDSGGIQKEAYILKVPCVTLMNSTAWIETVNDGWNILAGTDTGRIIELARDFQPNHLHSNLFGEGSCHKIKNIIANIVSNS